MSTCTIVMAGQLDRQAALTQRFKAILSQYYNGAEITITGEPQWGEGAFPAAVADIRLFTQDNKGHAIFKTISGINGTVHEADVTVPFKAFLGVAVAKRRIRPRERISKDNVTKRRLEVSSGFLAQQRGLLLSYKDSLKSLDSRQTVLAGQNVLLSMVVKTPDTRNGDKISLEIVRGALRINTSGVAQQESHIGKSLRVMAVGTKKILTGRLIAKDRVRVEI